MKIYNRPNTKQIGLICDVRMQGVEGISGADPTSGGGGDSNVPAGNAPRHL